MANTAPHQSHNRPMQSHGRAQMATNHRPQFCLPPRKSIRASSGGFLGALGGGGGGVATVTVRLNQGKTPTHMDSLSSAQKSSHLHIALAYPRRLVRMFSLFECRSNRVWEPDREFPTQEPSNLRQSTYYQWVCVDLAQNSGSNSRDFVKVEISFLSCLCF